MRNYDFEKIKIIISEQKPERAIAGIREDWYYTSRTIFENGKYVDEDFNDIIAGKGIAGIAGTAWGTPVMEIYLKDNDVPIYFDVYTQIGLQGQKPDTPTHQMINAMVDLIDKLITGRKDEEE